MPFYTKASVDFGIWGVLEPLLLGYQRMTLSGLQTKCANVNRRALIQEQQFKQPCLCYKCTLHTHVLVHAQTPFFCTRAHTHPILLCMCTHTPHSFTLTPHSFAHTCTRTHTHTPHSFAHTPHLLHAHAQIHTHPILLHSHPILLHSHPILLHTHPILLHARMHTHTYRHTPHSFVHTHHSFACSHTHPILLNRFPLGHIFAIFCYCLLFVEMSLN